MTVRTLSLFTSIYCNHILFRLFCLIWMTLNMILLFDSC
uniref:Uncharacterized protein n=1 Tax=Arundo donax TaxID=35708 RepID=A0A0A9ECU2_ARUDO